MTTPHLLRPAGWRDTLFLWRLRNEEEVRSQSFSTDPVGLWNHLRWLRAVFRDPRRRLYVAPGVGQVRLDEENGAAEISIAIQRDHRGGGAGTALLEDAIALAGQPLLARIKRQNEASIRAFARAGFAVVEEGEIVVMRHGGHG